MFAGAWWMSGDETPPPVVVASAPPKRAPKAPTPRSKRVVVAAPPAAAVRAPEPPDDGPVTVRCVVGRGLEGREHVLTVADPSEPNGVRLEEGRYDGSTLSLTASRGARSAHLVFPGSNEPAVPLSWTLDDDGRTHCTVAALPPPADAPLFGNVRGAANLPDGTVFLEGCSASDAPVGADGSFFAVTSAGPCSMRAWRQAGSLRIPGPWVPVEAVAGMDVEVELSVPTFAPAGLGIGFTAPGGGITVAAVHQGTPANQAGLGVGDRITRIDGIPTESMDADGFLQHGLGPEGSQVRLEGMTADGETFEVTITRQQIGPI